MIIHYLTGIAQEVDNHIELCYITYLLGSFIPNSPLVPQFVEILGHFYGYVIKYTVETLTVYFMRFY